jgi:uncharacterized protein (TIGR02271 family)
MAIKNRFTALGVFHDRASVERAIDELLREGFSRDQIGVVARSEEDSDGGESQAGEGAAIGGAAGAGVAGLVSLGMSFGVIPVVGPILAVGPWIAALLSAAGGAAVAGLAGALIGWGVPQEEAAFYESEVRAGGFLVTVNADRRCEEAQQILHRMGGYSYRSVEGKTAEEKGIRLREERLHVQKERVQAGEVTVRKVAKTEQKSIEVPVTREEVVVERRSVDGKTAGDGIGEEDVIRIPVTEERIRVEKKPVVTEEVRVGKRRVEGTERVTDDVSKEELVVDRDGDVRVTRERAGSRR